MRCPFCATVECTDVVALFDHFAEDHPDRLDSLEVVTAVTAGIYNLKIGGRMKKDGVCITTLARNRDGEHKLRRLVFLDDKIDWLAKHTGVAADQYHDRQPPNVTKRAMLRDVVSALRRRWGL